MNRRHALAAGTALLSLCLLTTALWAALTKTGQSSTSFKASATAGQTVTGKTSAMSIADNGSTITITVPLAGLKTGMPLRDKNLLQTLEVTRFPAAVLSVQRGALTFPSANSPASGTATASLTLHGVTKAVSIKYSAKSQGTGYAVKGTSTINVDDFGVARPSYLGITLKPEFAVETSFQVSGP